MIPNKYYKQIAKFNEELNQFAEYTGEKECTLYEDQFTMFTLSNIRIEENKLVYLYDEKEDYEVLEWDYNGEHYTNYEEISESIKFWRSCLKRAKRYWEMDTEKLDSLQNGEIEDSEDSEEE